MLVEQRQTRKIFKVKAVIAASGAAPVLVRTADISGAGMSVTLPDPLPVGFNARIACDLLVEGKPTPLSTGVRVTSCIFSSGEFKVALQFTGLEPAAASVLGKFLR